VTGLPGLATSRLSLRAAEWADLPLLIELNSDPEVMTYQLGRAATAAETEEEWERRLTRQSDPSRGLGYWLGFEDGVFLGWWSASSYAPDPATSGIGYRLRTAAWGRGLATEGALAMVGQAFLDPGIERVFASTMAVNSASRRVLEKVGLTLTSTWMYETDDPLPGSELGEVGYELTRAEWAATSRRTPG
jgi:RimJ/RimL family protein N-acetyltransferase